jgi:hypothetical protein
MVTPYTSAATCRNRDADRQLHEDGTRSPRPRHPHCLLETGHDVCDCFEGLRPFANGAKKIHLVDGQLRSLENNPVQTTRRTPGKLLFISLSANSEYLGEHDRRGTTNVRRTIKKHHFRNTRNNTNYSRPPYKFTDAQTVHSPFL